jgi:hypothetical protein
VVSSDLPDLIRDELPSELPEDIFSATTRVGPPPTGFDAPSMAPSGPLPPPPLTPDLEPTSALPRDLLDAIDLDSDAPIPTAAPQPVKPAPPRPSIPKPAPPAFPKPASPAIPGPAPRTPADDPFADLALGPPPSAPPPPRTPADDPFADLALDAAPLEAPKPLRAAPGLPATAADPFADFGGPAAPAAKVVQGRDRAELGLEDDGAPGDSLEIDRSEPTELSMLAAARPPAPPKGLGVQVGDGATRDSSGNIDFGEVSPPAASGGDPFADLDLGAPAPPSPPPPAPAAASPPAAASQDLFGGLGDPFAGIQTPSRAAPPPLPTAGGQDLFPEEGPADAEPFGGGAGDDPFAGLGTAAMSSDQDADLGLGIDADGRISGKPAPPPPAPTKTLSAPQPDPAEPARPRPVAAQPAPMAPAFEPPRAGGSLAYKLGFGLLLMLIVLFVFIVFRTGGKPDLTQWSTYVEAFTGQTADEQVVGDLRARALRSTTYPNKDGLPLVVLWGEIENLSGEARRGLAVTGQLLGAGRLVRKELTVPAGVMFEPHEVHALSGLEAVADAYRARARPAEELAPGQSMPFMVVMPEAPEDLLSLTIRVQAIATDDPLAGLPAATPAPEPAPAPAPAPAPGPVKKPPPARPGKPALPG